MLTGPGSFAVVMQAPGWGPSGAYLERTLTPLLAGLEIQHYAVRNTPGGNTVADADAQSTAKLCDDLEAERCRLGADRLALIGHSHGALVALAYAVRYPARVAALALVGASLEAPGSTPVARRLVSEFRRDPRRRTAIEWLDRHPSRQAAVRDDRSLARWMRATAPLSFFDLSAMERFQAALRDAPMPSYRAFRSAPAEAEPWVRRGVDGITVPALLVVGRQDAVTATDAAADLGRRLQAARILVVDHAGHNPWVERPRTVADSITRFLQEAI